MSAVASNVIRMSVICYHPQFLVRIIRIKVNPNHPQVKVIITILGRSREVVDGAVCRDHASKLIRDFISLCQHEEEDEAGVLIGGMSFPLSSFSCICSCTHLVYLVCELPVVLTGTVIDLFHVVYTLFEHGRSNIGKYYISPWNRNKSFVNNFIAKNKS